MTLGSFFSVSLLKKHFDIFRLALPFSRPSSSGAGCGISSFRAGISVIQLEPSQMLRRSIHRPACPGVAIDVSYAAGFITFLSIRSCLS